jgi:hypothetical protein
MKACILLSGLQRNFEPFIENQLKCVIDKYNLDVFIYTSDENLYRNSKDGISYYVEMKKFENNISFFKDKYKNLKNIYIDYDNCKFREFITKNNIIKNKNHTVNMISSYFKVNECIKLMEEYENENDFKYDVVLRCRLDFFAFNDFLDITNIDKDTMYMPFCAAHNHIDDSCILMNRHHVEYVKNFINVIISYDDNSDHILIEQQLFYYLKKKYNVVLSENLSYRVGLVKISTVPYFDKHCKNSVFSLEYGNTVDVTQTPS